MAAKPSHLYRLLLLLFASGLGCAAAPDPAAERAFLRGDERGAIERFAERLEHPSKREALDANLLATAALVGGDHERSRRAFIEAGIIMGSFPSPQPGAIIGAEGSKIYLGDPYECAMNSLYTAILLIEAGDEQNARAALKNGILNDSDSKEKQYQSDIAALFLLEAWLSLRAGKEDLARQDLERLLELAPGCPLADPALLKNANTVLVIDLGIGPQKIASGFHGELATFVSYPSPATELSLEVGGHSLTPIEGVDVSFQAMTRGGRQMDGLLRGKAVFKDVTEIAGTVVIDEALRKLSDGSAKNQDTELAIGGGLLLLSALTRAEADTRHWHLLPAQTYLWIGRVEPGLHSVDLTFRRSNRSELPKYRQSWHHVPFVEEGPNVYYFRTGLRRGYGHPRVGGN